MAFQSLTRGIRFKNSNNKAAKALFQPAKVAEDLTSAGDNFPSELDLFANAASTSATSDALDRQTSRKKPKLSHPSAESIKRDSEEVASLYRLHKIKVTGPDVPSPIVAFEELAAWQQLDASSMEALAENMRLLEFQHPTAIQVACTSILLDQRDLLACAPTGSGKTLAFLLPLLLHHLAGSSARSPDAAPTTAIIVEPTRELARQVYNQAVLLSRNTGYKVHLLGEKLKGSEVLPSEASMSFRLSQTRQWLS